MEKKLIPFVIALVLLLFAACDSKEIDRLKAQNDSLRKELEERHSLVGIMNEVKGLLDSIDANRQVLRVDLDKGTSYENFKTRLGDINKHIKTTNDKISSLEKELGTSERHASAYLMMVNALKSEVAMRFEEIALLEDAVEQYRTENKGLVQTVKLQQTQMADMQAKIDVKQQELSLVQAKVDEMVNNFQVSEAESYYARAKAVEEAAKRTRLAPHKRRETYREALELYKKAYSLGKKEAQANITELEKKVR